MSTDVDQDDDESARLSRISLELSEDGELWIARDEDTGVTTQGGSRDQALANLDEAVAGYYGAGEEPDEEYLREIGIDPDANTSGSLDDSDIFE